MKWIGKTSVLMIIFLGATVVTGLAWLNNLWISKGWFWDVFVKGEVYRVETKPIVESQFTGLATGIEVKFYPGLVSWLNWTFVDISTVSTFVPFLGFLLIFIGFCRILGNRKVSGCFPFYKDYHRMMVILGLCGTFWGIIMLGYYPPGTVDMSALMLCVHTALYSTLIAVLWVFLIAGPAGDAMQWWYKKVTGRPIGEEIDISSLFEEFGGVVSESSKNLKRSSAETKEFTSQTAKAKTALQEMMQALDGFEDRTGMEIFGAFEDSYKKMAVTMAGINNWLEAQQKQQEVQTNISKAQQDLLCFLQGTSEQMKETLEELRRELAEERKDCRSANERAGKAEREKSSLVSRIGQIRELLGSRKE